LRRNERMREYAVSGGQRGQTPPALPPNFLGQLIRSDHKFLASGAVTH
jgi:hypothetical protein